MSAPVFLCPEAADAAVGSVLTVAGAEGRHAVTVQRRGVGEAVDLVDGAGRRASARILSVHQGRFEARVESVAVDQDSPVTLIQALAKGGRDEQAVESAIELGVTAVTPWAAERSIAQWRGPKVAKGIASWEALALAAAKQSRRALVPTVNPLVTTRELAAQVKAATASGGCVLVLHEVASVPLAGLGWERPEQEVWVIVGPEGGISDAELTALTAAGALSVRLGRHVLRSSSAGPAAIAALAAIRGDWA
ncbi:16S rRNA (uracil(1498)-N(3))-methyltransferase [Demequina sp.]|uniref:16S rRNA (uracil(1498)-N(3))-methyltransferase n=1 Tax=Demequina sp. TaxID=2050685 RepID=UPI003D10D3E2